MDKKNQELRATLKKLWPIQSKKMMSLLVPPDEGNQLNPDWSICEPRQFLISLKVHRYGRTILIKHSPFSQLERL